MSAWILYINLQYDDISENILENHIDLRLHKIHFNITQLYALLGLGVESLSKDQLFIRASPDDRQKSEDWVAV